MPGTECSMPYLPGPVAQPSNRTHSPKVMNMPIITGPNGDILETATQEFFNDLPNISDAETLR